MFDNNERWAAFVRQMKGDKRFIVGIGVESEYIEVFIRQDNITKEQLAVVIKEMLGDEAEVEIPSGSASIVRVRKAAIHPPP